MSGRALADVPVSKAISAGDSMSVVLTGVANPPVAGGSADFAVSSTSDPVPAAAASYTIVANVSPPVVVTVEPSSTGALASYTISNLYAPAALTAGVSTVMLEAPAGTVFPNNPGCYSITDATTPSGSGTVTEDLTGEGPRR